jgi:hypothetical protein
MNGRLHISLIHALVATVAWPATGVLADELRIAANTPSVEVSTRTTSGNFMPLPALEYAFEVALSCSAPFEARGVSLSIADTRISLDESQLENASARRLSLTIPAGQIPPVRTENFCLANHTEGDGEELLEIPAVLSVQGSLVCADEEQSRITYASTPLNVIVHCARQEAPVTTD